MRAMPSLKYGMPFVKGMKRHALRGLVPKRRPILFQGAVLQT